MVGNQYNRSTGTSTQSSSLGFDAASSQYRMSTHTSPSSVLPPTNPTLLSPYTPSHYHGVSLQPQTASDTPRFQRASSRSQSLRNRLVRTSNQADTNPQTIDPRLLSPNNNGEDVQEEYLERRIWYNGR